MRVCVRAWRMHCMRQQQNNYVSGIAVSQYSSGNIHELEVSVNNCESAWPRVLYEAVLESARYMLSDGRPVKNRTLDIQLVNSVNTNLPIIIVTTAPVSLEFARELWFIQLNDCKLHIAVRTSKSSFLSAESGWTHSVDCWLGPQETSLAC
jgi:hypothetical protein